MAAQDDIEELRKNWVKERRMGGATFAGLAKLKPFPDGKQLTNSARSTFLNCRRKYEYTYVYGLAPRKPSVPFLVGGLFHDELDQMYTNGVFEEDEARKRIAKACERASHSEGLTPEDSDKIWMQQAIAFGAVKGYAQQYLAPDLKRWKVIAAEGSFDIELPGGWRYRGKTDLVVQDRKTGRNLLVEHKTAGQLNAGYVAKLPLDNQILGYAWAKSQEKVKLDGVVYNVTKKPGIRQRQNETMNQFYKRVEDEYILNPGAYFYRETLVFEQSDLDRFSNELKQFLGEIDRCHDEKYFYQNTTQCTTMGVCPFMKLCLEGVNKETLMHYRIKERAHEELPQED